jgi:hypothetical protein
MPDEASQPADALQSAAAPKARSDSAQNRAADQTVQETDVWWGAYAGRAMWPSFAVCMALTALIADAAWWLYDAGAPGVLSRYLAYALAAAVWLVQILRWGYRTISINYRLTNRRLFLDRGFRNPGRVIELDHVVDVKTEIPPLGQLIGIGRIYVVATDGQEPMVLEGVRDAESTAELIRTTAARTRT